MQRSGGGQEEAIMLVFPHAPPGVRPGGINWNNPGNMPMPPIQPVLETQNLLSYPTGPEHAFSVGEGMRTLIVTSHMSS